GVPPARANVIGIKVTQRRISPVRAAKDLDPPGMTQRGVWQAHAIAPVTVSLIEPGTPTEAEGVPACLGIHASSIVRHAYNGLGGVGPIASPQGNVDSACPSLESIIYQLSKG